VASSWILFFSYQDDARSNTHQSCELLGQKHVTFQKTYISLLEVFVF